MHLFATLAGFQIHAMPESDAFSAGDLLLAETGLQYYSRLHRQKERHVSFRHYGSSKRFHGRGLDDLMNAQMASDTRYRRCYAAPSGKHTNLVGGKVMHMLIRAI